MQYSSIVRRPCPNVILDYYYICFRTIYFLAFDRLNNEPYRNTTNRRPFRRSSAPQCWRPTPPSTEPACSDPSGRICSVECITTLRHEAAAIYRPRFRGSQTRVPVAVSPSECSKLGQATHPSTTGVIFECLPSGFAWQHPGSYPATRWGIRLFIRTGIVSFYIIERLAYGKPHELRTRPISCPKKGKFLIVRYSTIGFGLPVH